MQTTCMNKLSNNMIAMTTLLIICISKIISSNDSSINSSISHRIQLRHGIVRIVVQ